MRRAAIFAALMLVSSSVWAATTSVCGLPGSASQSYCLSPQSDGSLNVNATVTPGGTQDVNLTKVNGTATATGHGTASGAVRVELPTDGTGLVTVNPATAANWGIAATGAAAPANAQYVSGLASGATGGLTAGLKTCDLHAKYDASDNGNVTLVTGVSGRKVYVCGFILANGGTATNLSLTEGSDANCASNNAGLTPVYQVLANQSVGVMSPFWAGLVVSTNAYYVCIKSSAGNAHQGEIWYTIQ